MFPGEEITIARGYLSVIESLASVLPSGFIQLGRKVTKIEWQPDESLEIENCPNNKPSVKLHFVDGSIIYALSCHSHSLTWSFENRGFTKILPCFTLHLLVSRLEQSQGLVLVLITMYS